MTGEGGMPLMGFDRGDGPLVSVLLPTRGRPEMLCHALDSLFSLSVNKDKIEYLLKIDDDDEATLRMVERLIRVPTIPVRVYSSSRGRGYPDVHTWLNFLAGEAKGDWLLVWNDDALMRTEAWDHVLLFSGIKNCWHRCQDCFMLVIQPEGRPGCNEFYFLRRKVFEILGHLSLNQHVDNWLFSVMEMVGSVRQLSVSIEHDSDKMEDQTRKDSEASYQAGSDELRSGPMVKAKAADVLKLLAYIEAEEAKRRLDIRLIGSNR